MEDFNWVCNECDFANFTSSIGEDVIEQETFGCINCRGFEFHKVPTLTRVQQIIQDIEEEYISSSEPRLLERKKLLPLRDKKQIKGLIWNLLTDKKWRAKISGNDYNQIMDVWIERMQSL